jgi:hypothetical protein
VNFATNSLNRYYVVSRYFQKGSYLSVKHELYTFRIDKLAFPTVICSSRINSGTGKPSGECRKVPDWHQTPSLNALYGFFLNQWLSRPVRCRLQTLVPARQS